MAISLATPANSGCGPQTTIHALRISTRHIAQTLSCAPPDGRHGWQPIRDRYGEHRNPDRDRARNPIALAPSQRPWASKLMTGVLKIHCIVVGGSHFGHSWIEYCPIDGQPRTYSTWGNHPRRLHNGLQVDLDHRYQSTASRSRILGDEQEQRLMERIEHYRQLGEDAWQILAPCSAFAADVWNYSTGEALAHRQVYVSTPATLADSIRRANDNDGIVTEPTMAAITDSRHLPEKLSKRRNRSARRR